MRSTSNNPVLARVQEEAKQGGAGALYAEGTSAVSQATAGTAAADGVSAAQLQQMYDQPPASPTGLGVAVQLPDVVVKTGILFVLVVLGAVVGWNAAASMPLLVWGAAIVGLVLGFVNVLKRKVSPPLVMAYALVQGVFLGGISAWYQSAFGAQNPYLVQQAVIGTLVAFGVMLALYQTRIIKVNGTFMKVMLVSMVSYGLIAIASLIAALFGVGGGWGFYGVGWLGILLCMFGVGLAAFSLALDFESIKQSIAYGLPQRESWRLAFGLMVTLIWLYLEILRLLAIIASSNR